jgi:hypothetical protein
MRDQVIDTVGQVGTILPAWMTSKQANGRVLGFTPAWVLAYVKPGRGDQIAYYIRTKFGERLNLIDFEVDRYELDRLLSIHWDPVADSTHGAWVPPGAETTFDLVLHYQITVYGNTGGTGYAIGDRILILGSQLGGLDGLNDTTIVIQDVGIAGNILLAHTIGQAPLFSEGDTFNNIAGTNTIGTGINAIFNLVVDSGEITVFDSSSLRFEAPVDNYTNTDAYDKYLVFPKRNILV